MVSFQCHSCGDVVKKPKLDQHQSRCHSGFDCIDCSTTFNTPADYKSHTSCISEAEKYQKALYKGPKAGNNRNNQQNSGPRGHGNNFSNGYQNQRGGYGGRPPWSQPRNQATGSNDTPLGTPRRRSPVTKVDGPEKSNSATDVVVESTQMTEKVKEGKEKEKNKKRKHEDEPERENDKVPKKKVKVDETAVDSASIPLPQPQEEEKKRRKNDKKEKKGEKEVNDDKTVDKEKKRKEKREKKEKQGKDVGEELKEKKEKRDKKEKKDKKEKSERKRVKSEK